MDWTEILKKDKLAVSVVLALVVLLLRYLIGRIINRREEIPGDIRRRWLVNTRFALIIVLFVGVAYIWVEEIRDLTFSLVAIALAIVIAVKEILLCLSGAFMRTVSGSFSVGDRIEIKGVRGDVFDHNLLCTSILEIGPGKSSNQYTGRAITLPNSAFLDSYLINESFTDEYVLHVFTIPIWAGEDWKAAEDALLKAAFLECSPYMSDTRKYMHRMGKRLGLDVPSVEPRVSITLPEPGRINLVVRIAIPTRLKSRIEQAIIRRFLESFQLTSLPQVSNGSAPQMIEEKSDQPKP